MRPSTSVRLRRGLALCLLLGLGALVLRVTSAARLERADFVMNNGAEVATLDPAIVTGVPEGRVIYALFEGLTVKDPRTLAPVPGMADRWSVSDDGLTYDFHIREGARWSNGDPVTAKDFALSWERLLDPATAAEYAYQLWYVVGAQAYTTMPDDRLYVSGPGHGLWVEERDAGHARVGLTGFALEGLDPDLAPKVLATEGGALAAGAPLVSIGGRSFALPFAARGVHLSPALPSTEKALRADPWEAGWVCELEPDAAGLADAERTGALLPGPRFRTEVAWPDLVGIDAPSDHELVVRLEAPTPYFINLTGFYPLFPVDPRALAEAKRRWPDTWQIRWVRPENIVTNGPFLLADRRINDRIRLVKNPDYWDADHVAFRTIDVLAIENYGTMLNLYLTGGCDWIDRVSPTLVPRLLRREDFRPQPYLGTYFYRVNTTKAPFDDRRVRQALALTIDRRAICEKVTKAGQVPNWSLVPDGFADYRKAEMSHAPIGDHLERYDAAFAADCARAKQLLVEAGYGPDGKPFPTIEIHYNTSEAHRDIAEVIADSWRKNLGIDAQLLNQEWKVYLDTQSDLDYDVSRSAWIGDYLDPNTFLDLFVTGGENNKTGWGDPRYDALIESAAHESDPVARMRTLHDAEAILMQELPILPIYTYVTQNMKKPRLGGWSENLQDDHFPKFWYWMDDAELAAKRAGEGDEWQLVDPGGPAEGLYSPAALRERARHAAR